MTMHQVRVDLRDHRAKAHTVEAIEVPEQGLFYRAYDGSLRPIDGDRLHSGDGWIVTPFHEDPAAAWAEAADELGRRAQALAAIRLVCVAGGEVAHA